MAVLGSNLIGFGDGPDGGREAIFDGEVNYRAKGSKNWTGYGVIQAKYKTTTEGTARDQKWVLNSLSRELELFHTSEKRNPKPAYYLLITNVALSSANRGGKAKIDEVFEKYSDRLPLSGWAVWDANQLRTYLPKYPEIRNNFLQFFTVGDFLAKVLEGLNLQSRNLHEVLTTYLIRELRHDICARLDQTGNKTETQVPLPKLFFDIPAAKEPTSTAPDEVLDPSGKLPKGVLHEMLNDASRKLDPMTIRSEEKTSTIQSEEKASGGMMRFPARYVLQGGPGSGKSTLGQFLAQIHRAALLYRVKPQLLPADVVDLISQVSQYCTNQDLYWPTASRYPFRIELVRFAKALASQEDGVNSFAGYLRRSISGDHSVDHESLVAFFGAHPTLIILDGLDEVPHTSNRALVIQTIKNFLDELRLKNADVFLVATTRVQGYQDEFAEESVEVRFLRPLSRTRALQYVRTYASVRYGVNHQETTERIVKAIEDTETHSLTSQLLSTPLQASFLVTVIAAKGSPGSNRWSLFKSYYDTIYDRELQRAVPLSNNVLRDQPQLIFRLHQIVGFWLQFLEETNPSESTYLKEDVFRRIAECLLTENGYTDDELKQCSESLVYAARERLIFLTSKVAGELSFEVRSLQEFMAAECLMTGDSSLIRERLKQLCGCFYWRNTILFTANKCYADSSAEQFKDTICALPGVLNSEAVEYGVAFKPGAELALDLVHSGATEGDPRSTIMLTDSALERIDLAEEFSRPWAGKRSRIYRRSVYTERLAAVHSVRTNDLFRARIESRLRQPSSCEADEAWSLLSRLPLSQVSWAEELVQKELPTKETLVGIDLEHMCSLDLSTAVQDAIAERLVRFSPSVLNTLFRQYRLRGDKITGPLKCIIDLFRPSQDSVGRIRLSIAANDDWNVELALVFKSCSDKRGKNLTKLLSSFSRCHPSWLPLKCCDLFYEQPDLHGIIRVLKRFLSERTFVKPDPALLDMLPWPVAMCINACTSRRKASVVLQGLIDLSQRHLPKLHEIEAKIGLDVIDARDFAESTDPFDVLSQKEPAVSFPVGIARGERVAVTKLSGKDFGSTRFEQLLLGFPLRKILSLVRNRPLKQFIAEAFASLQSSALADPQISLCCVQHVSNASTIDFNMSDGEGDFEPSRWFAVCAEIGNRDLVLSGLRLHSPSFARLIDALQVELSDLSTRGEGQEKRVSRRRLGILMFLANCSWLGVRLPNIPADVLIPGHFSEIRHQFGALLVRLARRDLDVSEVDAAMVVVQRSLTENDRVEYARRLCDALEWHCVDSEAFMRFVCDVRRSMPESVPFGRARCDGVMRMILETRRSRLHEPGALRKLWLPDVKNLAQLRPAEGY